MRAAGMAGTGLALLAPMGLSFFESLKRYVGFTDDSSAALRALHPLARPCFGAIVDDFYATIVDHPEAQAAITGGAAQIDRLKRTLIQWLDGLLLGPHDEAYYERRARIGRVHVQIALPQAFMFTAMNRIRLRLLEIAQTRAAAVAVNQLLDIELAIMLETYREDLEAKNRSAERLATIGQFAASISHELRNPLSVVESSLYLLRRHLGPGAEAPQVAKHLDRIGAEVTRATKTIQDLLDLARNRPPQRHRTPLRALIERALDAAALPAEITVEVSAPAELAVEVDPDQLQQVLVNLFANAAQAMRGPGRIQIDGELSPAGARVRVRDDGPGVPADARRRIFDALYTTKAKGSGLGLALCRRIMEAHGGTIDLEPSDRGASFVLGIPAPAPVVGAISA
jgi:two-component system sensor histidine kinase HydH